jgi:hypothetical protein
MRLDWWWHGKWRTQMDGFYDALAEAGTPKLEQ